MSDLPLTRGRLSSSLSVRLIVRVEATASLANIPVVRNVAGSFGTSFTFGPEIGFIDIFEREQTRENVRRYSLGDHAYEPLDIIPNKIKTSLNVRRIVLYKSDLLESLGFLAGSIFYQQKSFGLQERMNGPKEPFKTDTTTVDYLDCWLEQNPIRYDISENQNQLVIQNARITVGKVIVSTPVERAIPAIAKNLLPFPLPLNRSTSGGLSIL